MRGNDASTALLLLDLQNEMVDPNGKIGAGGLARAVQERRLLDRVAAVLGAFRGRRLPVVHVRLGFRPDYLDALSVAPRIGRLKEAKAAVVGTWGTEFPPAVAPADGELVVTKQCVNPFFNTGLMAWLSRRLVSRLVLCGVATNLVVESTARYADDAGFEVVVLEDCCASPNPEWHRFSVQHMLPLFGEVLPSEVFLSKLDRR